MMSDQLNNFSKELQANLHPTSEYHQKLVQKGLLLYRQNHVYKKQYNPPTYISGKVQDVIPVDVTLNMNEPLNSQCSCPQEGICRHQLALFFSAYSENSSVFEWVQEWKSQDQSFDILKTVKRASDLLNEAVPPDLSKGIDAWLHYFKQTFEDANISNEYFLETSVKRNYRRLLDFIPVEREWKPLYRLFAAYEALKWLNGVCVENEFHGLSSLFDFLLQEAEESLNQLSVTSAPFAFDPYIQYLRDDSHFLIESSSYFYSSLFHFYRLLWSRLFRSSSWRHDEWNRWNERLIHDINTKEKIEIPNIMAFIHLSFLEEDDDRALSFLKELMNDDPTLILFMPFWIEELKIQKAFQRQYRYINCALAMLPLFFQDTNSSYERQSFTRLFLQSIGEAALMEKNPYLLEKVYRGFLPYSYYKYDSYLFSQKKFREWVELQHLSAKEIDLIDKEKLTIIAKEAPQMVMPLYHEAIEHLISSRNRSSYKKAVRYLKKLRTVYKKRNRMLDWDRFFNHLVNRTKRLRAFQEECRKGKLIDVE